MDLEPRSGIGSLYWPNHYCLPSFTVKWPSTRTLDGSTVSRDSTYPHVSYEEKNSDSSKSGLARLGLMDDHTSHPTPLPLIFYVLVQMGLSYLGAIDPETDPPLRSVREGYVFTKYRYTRLYHGRSVYTDKFKSILPYFQFESRSVMGIKFTSLHRVPMV